MSRVRIVGGGLTGILAAFQAHRMGARDIELFERFDRLGGIALPDTHGDAEIREGCIYFGPRGDPLRSLLEGHGVRFAEFDNRFGSVSRGSRGPVYTEDFGGPALPAAAIGLSPPAGPTLADRLGCYDDSIAFPLARYVRWHLGCNPASLDAGAAVPLAINRVFPSDARLDALAAAKTSDPLADELFGIPRGLWGYRSNARASLPVGGFTAMFRHCRLALEAIGVTVRDTHLATPRAMLAGHRPDDVLVWAANPMPLFKAAGLETPKAPGKRFATHTFAVEWSGALPFYVQNFTAEGSCFRVYLYESGCRTLLTAECVVEEAGAQLAGDIAHMLDGFDGRLTIGERLHHSVKPRWLYHSVETIAQIRELRDALGARLGPGFVAGGWETYAKGEKFAEVETALPAALGVRAAKVA